MNKDVIYFITKEINKLYDYLAKNGLGISEKEKNKLIYNLKLLIKQESELYSYLTFDDIIEVREYFDNNYDKIGLELAERVINKLDEIILDNYFKEFSLKYNEDPDYNEDDIKFDRNTVIYAKALRRDLFYLKIYFLNKFLNNYGLISSNIGINDILIKKSINNTIFKHCSYYSNIENEFINNNYEINDYYLNSNLVKQLSLFSPIISKTVKLEVFEDAFIDNLNDILTVNEDNLYDINNTITLLESLVHILSTLMLEKDFVVQINNKFENIENGLIYYLFYDNFKEINKDKNKVKSLSLNDKFF